MPDGELPRQARDLTGQTFGELTAMHPEHSNGRKRWWRFQCSCGAQCVRCGADVVKAAKQGATPRCGAPVHTAGQNRTHGMSKHPAYWVWRSMRDRCRLPTHQAWENYGARGIRVCPEWDSSFDAFWRDMGPTYMRGLDLDRIDNDKGYTPENCRWTSRRENSMNKRNTERRVDVVALSKETGINTTTIYYRLANGWSVEDLRLPPDSRNRPSRGKKSSTS